MKFGHDDVDLCCVDGMYGEALESGVEGGERLDSDLFEVWCHFIGPLHFPFTLEQG